MVIDDGNREQPQHLDLIEFCLAEFDITEQSSDVGGDNNHLADERRQQQQRENDLMVVNRRKWPKNRIVDYELLGKCKKTFYTFYNEYMQLLLLFEIDNINKYTSYLELDKLFANCEETRRYTKSALNYTMLNTRKKLIVDIKTLRTLNRNFELNWLNLANSIYPIKTIGDGNCLVEILWVFFWLRVYILKLFNLTKNIKVPCCS
jgi:hypothetical protein